MSADEVACAVGVAAADELSSALTRVEHCIGQLSEGQVWSRSGDGLNSIGNLVLHLGGNVRQWIVSGLGGVPDTRDRPAEFAERVPIPKTELLGRLRTIVDDAKAVLASSSAEQLMRARRIQGFEMTGLAAIFNSVPHFRGHTQEIIHITRSLLGDKYVFLWTPSTPEQGA